MIKILKNWFLFGAQSSNKVKTCARCKLCLSASEFWRSSDEADGLQRWCIKCKKNLPSYGNKKQKKKQKKKMWSPMRSTTLARKHSHLVIENVPTETKIILFELAKQRNCSISQLGHQMIREFLILNNK